MPLRRVAPAEAAAPVQQEHDVYLDVHAVAGFEAGHTTDAYKNPLLHMPDAGPAAGTHCSAEYKRAFPEITRSLVGGRSLRAAALPRAAAYARVIDQQPERTHAALAEPRP